MGARRYSPQIRSRSRESIENGASAVCNFSVCQNMSPAHQDLMLCVPIHTTYLIGDYLLRAEFYILEL